MASTSSDSSTKILVFGSDLGDSCREAFWKDEEPSAGAPEPSAGAPPGTNGAAEMLRVEVGGCRAWGGARKPANPDARSRIPELFFTILLAKTCLHRMHVIKPSI